MANPSPDLTKKGILGNLVTLIQCKIPPGLRLLTPVFLSSLHDPVFLSSHIDSNGYKKWGVDGDSRANFLVDQPQVLEFRVPDSSYLQFQAPVTISKAAGKVPLSDCICIRLYFIIALKLLAYNPITKGFFFSILNEFF